MVLPLSGAALLSLFGLVSATKCPTDGIRNYFANHDKTKCFFFLDHPLEFFDSNYLCGDNGGMLASIGTPEDNKIIAQHSSGHAKAWIGGVDYLDLGNWYWLDDSHFAYWNWGPDEPKHFPLHDCAAIDTVTGFWENHLCNKKMNALCQVISIPDSKPVYNESLAKGPFLVTAAVTYAWNATECLLQQYQEVNELQVVKVLCDEIFGKKYDCSAIVAVSVPDGITTVTFNGSYPEQIGLEATKSVFVRQWLNFSGEFVSDYFASAAQKLYNNGLKTAFADIMGRHPKHEVRITGLSLGGALATLFSDLIVTDGLADPTQIRIITYGEPKVGNQLFSLKHVGRVGGYVFRLINRRDPIPLLPYALLDLLQPYAEHQFEVRYPSGTDAGYVVCDGSIYCPPHPFPYPEFILDNLMDHLTYFAPPNKTIADFGAQNCHWQ